MDCQGPAEVTVPDFAELIDRKLGPVPVQSIGPTASSLLGELLNQVCAKAELSSTLPRTCGSGHFDIKELRARVLVDLLRVPQGYMAQSGATLTLSERAAFALLDAMAGRPDPASVAQRVASSFGYVPVQGDDPLRCVVPTANASDASSIAVLLFWRLSQNTNAAVARSPAETQALIEQTLVDQGAGAQGAFSEAQRALIARLVDATYKMHQQYQTLKSALSADALWPLLLAEAQLLEAALSLSHGQALSLPAEALTTLQAAAEARIDAFVRALADWLAERAQLPREVVDATETTLRFAAASSEDEAKRIVRGLLLGLGPWSDNWIAGLNLGVPRLKNGDTNVVVDGTLGYSAKQWGAVARAGMTVFDLDSDAYKGDTFKAGGNVDAWIAVAVGQSTNLEVRATVDGTVLDAQSIILEADTGDLIAFGSETSALYRFGGLLGLRTQGPLWAFGVWAGGGVQIESYDSISETPETDPRTLESESLGGQFEGRLRAQWEAWEDILALRAALDWKYYTLTRLSRPTTGSDFAELDTKALQIEAVGRAFLDIEALRAFEFVPGVGVGADHYQLAITGQETQVVTAPVFLLGIRRSVF